MAKVEELFQRYKKTEVDITLFELEEEIISTAKNNQLERGSLIKLFHNETDMFFKLDLAHILTDLKYKKIIPFLLKTANNQKEDIDNQFEAIIDLIKFEKPEAYDLMMELADPSNNFPAGWIINDLRDLENEGNKLAKKLIKGLITTYKHFAQYRKPDEKF